jgi:vancomycin resistance protein YoaR
VIRAAVVIASLAVALLSPAAVASPQSNVPLELVSRFTTYYPAGQPRVTNIHRAAVLLDRTLVRPRARFSLNERLRKRTRARGFVAAPSISGPIHVDSVGGGVSQVATTLYNAAFFAGLRLIDFRACHRRRRSCSWGRYSRG